MIEFICKKNNEVWHGKIKKFITHGNHFELMIESRSSIFMIIGKTSRGLFACFPDLELGCHLVNLKDVYWNTEKLTYILGVADGITVLEALRKIKDKI